MTIPLRRYFKCLFDFNGHTQKDAQQRTDDVVYRSRKLQHELNNLRAKTDALYKLIYEMRHPPHV